jgi:GntR family transcriptional repressor for pyruvate dehydrogenase complex
MEKSYPFQPLKRARLYEQVAEQIKQSIYSGHLKPGDRLPPERELSEIFQVGRPTIREALRTLSILGLIEVQSGSKGSMVKECDITQYLDAVREQLSWLLKVDEKTLKDLWEVRKYIELGIAHAVARNASEKDLKKLRGLLRKMEACGEDIHAYFPIAVEFHQQLAVCSRNRIFFMVWELFHDILLKGYIPRLKEIFPDGPRNLLRANRVLLEAIESKAPEAINRAMELHAEEERFFPPQVHQRRRGDDLPGSSCGEKGR